MFEISEKVLEDGADVKLQKFSPFRANLCLFTARREAVVLIRSSQGDERC